MSRVGYNRDVRHYEFNVKGMQMPYGTGDCLGIWAHNVPDKVAGFLKDINLDGNTILTLKRNDG